MGLVQFLVLALIAGTVVVVGSLLLTRAFQRRRAAEGEADRWLKELIEHRPDHFLPKLEDT